MKIDVKILYCLAEGIERVISLLYASFYIQKVNTWLVHKTIFGQQVVNM